MSKFNLPLWKEQTCQSCIYRNDTFCVRNPPTMTVTPNFSRSAYPIVHTNTENYYLPACAEWKRDETEEIL